MPCDDPAGRDPGHQPWQRVLPPRPVPAEYLALMRRIEESCTWELPFAGGRMLRDLLNHEGVAVDRKHVATLMRRMGIEALYRDVMTQ